MSEAVDSFVVGGAGVGVGAGAGAVKPPGVHAAAAADGFHSDALGLKPLIEDCCDGYLIPAETKAKR